MNRFKVIKKSKETKARLGRLKLKHALVETPVFMPIGTAGVIKTLKFSDVEKIGYNLILTNTYHLLIRCAKDKLLEKFKGIHNFTGWKGAILSDSGGYQVFSLNKIRKVKEDGVIFFSHLDGSKIYLTPEYAIEYQNIIGSDIIMVFDECLHWPVTEKEAEKSMKLSLKWAQKCKEVHKNKKQLLFGIVQGGTFKNLRKQSAEKLIDIGFDGYAIGGLSVGEPMQLCYEITDYTTSLLPENYPRYLMGVGKPIDIIQAVEYGIDMFDCVLPTRNARNKQLFTFTGIINIGNQKYQYDDTPVDTNCNCELCKNYSKGFLRYLFKANEITAMVLSTIHNLTFYYNLIKKIQKAIKEDNFLKFKKEFIKQFFSNDI